MYRIPLIALLLCAVAVSQQGRAATVNSWEGLRKDLIQQGCTPAQVDLTLGVCRQNGHLLNETQVLLSPVVAAAEEGLPTMCIFLKINEGLAKDVAWTNIQSAAERRLECLRRAEQLVLSAARPGRGGQHQHLVMHTCLAIESGLPVEVLQSLFTRPDGFRYGRLIHVIEAGETLQLAGMESANILHVMSDCLDRNLNGQEVERVVAVVLDGLRAGHRFDDIHAKLWVSADGSAQSCSE